MMKGAIVKNDMNLSKFVTANQQKKQTQIQKQGHISAKKIMKVQH